MPRGICSKQNCCLALMLLNDVVMSMFYPYLYNTTTIFTPFTDRIAAQAAGRRPDWSKRVSCQVRTTTAESPRRGETNFLLQNFKKSVSLSNGSLQNCRLEVSLVEKWFCLYVFDNAYFWESSSSRVTVCSYKHVELFFFLQLDKLKRSYHKLQRKQLKETSGGAKEMDLSGVTQLHEKTEVQQSISLCFFSWHYPSHLRNPLYCHLPLKLSIFIPACPCRNIVSALQSGSSSTSSTRNSWRHWRPRTRAWPMSSHMWK